MANSMRRSLEGCALLLALERRKYLSRTTGNDVPRLESQLASKSLHPKKIINRYHHVDMTRFL